jgi:hypothetical protein
MILSIAKEKTITPEALGNKKAKDPSTVTFKVPTSTDMERLLTEKPKDSEVFSEFVIQMTFTDDQGASIQPATIPSMPGVYPLVAEVAREILMSGMLGTDEKNE